MKLFSHRIFRSLYFKEAQTRNNLQKIVTMTFVEAFELYNESLESVGGYQVCRMQLQDAILSKEELDSSVEECSCEGGPLSSILSLIRVVFLSQAPNYSQERYRRTISENRSLLQDSILLSSCIVRTFAHMSENHPDFLYFSSLVLSTY